MHFQINKSVINKVDFEPNNAIKPFGLETADSTSFYSLEDNVGYRYSSNTIKDDYSDSERKREEHVIANDGEWLIELNEFSTGNHSLTRIANLTALNESYLMDFVLRYRFDKDVFSSAYISDRKISHNSSNIYHQHDTRVVKLVGESCTAEISLTEFKCPNGFKPTMYVRDSKEEWVVHVRLFPKKWDREVVKICNSWAGTRPIPSFLSKYLLSSEVFRGITWYRGEKKPYNNRLIRRFFNLVSFGLVRLKKDETIMLETSLVMK